MSKVHQKRIDKYFPRKAVAYLPGLSLVFHSTSVGILLSQLLYWHELGSKPGGWIYKTVLELKKETGLTRSQQETAIKKVVAMGVIDYKLASVPATRHFKLNIDKLENLLPGLKENAGIVYRNLPNQFAGNAQSITEITHKITSKNTPETTVGYRPSIGGIESLGSNLGRRHHYKKMSNDFGKKETP